MALPRFVAITSDYSGNKYMRYLNENAASTHKFLKLSGEEVLSSLSKFEVKIADCGKGFVHVRCCYNNKYWQRSSEEDSWIVAGANKPEEDQTKWSCTMFKPILVSNNPLSYRFCHVQLGQYASLCIEAVAPYDFCIEAKSSDEGTYDVFKIIDWETLVVLPKYIAVRGDNYSLLKAYNLNNISYQQFGAGELGDRYVGDEIFPNNNGSVRIRNMFFNKFWRRGQNDYINADADLESSINNRDTWFWPVMLDNVTIALQSEGNKKFCKRYTLNNNKQDLLSACDSKISQYARMIVEEPVLSRSIYNVKYRLMDNRMYDEIVDIQVANSDAVNTTRETIQMDVKLSYKDVLNWSWIGSVSLRLDYSAKVTGDIPIIAEAGKVEIYGSFSADYHWGKTEKRETSIDVIYTAVVPPMTRVKVKLMANKSSCDIPFSYTRRDVGFDGKPVIYNMDDGISTCSNCYNFHCAASEEPII